MDNNIILSICCTTYNQEKYIAKAVQSFIDQDVNFQYEILIHDDASTDSTSDILREFEIKYPNLIKVIYQTENQYSKGEMPSINLRYMAKGKYIAFCEGDDYWTDKMKLKKQVEFLEKNTEYIATAHWSEVVDEFNNKSSAYLNSDKIFKFAKKEYCFDDYRNEYIPGHANSIVQRNIFKNGSDDFKKIYKSSELVGDRTTYLILVLLGKIYVHQEIMSAYRYITDNGISYSSKVANQNRHDKWFKYYLNLEKNIYKEMNREVKLKRLKYQHLMMALQLYMKGRTLENKKVLSDIWKVSNHSELIRYFPKAVLNRIDLYFRYKN
ncbi:MAG: glycosyltransferase [Clostridium sp.]|uniref:glycosyltransferase n=1 Tax=Clostridium sp. TaxID=1506 RepID=UPI003F2FAA02